jgi:UDP-glucuronate 4-epimerase
MLDNNTVHTNKENNYNLDTFYKNFEIIDGKMFFPKILVTGCSGFIGNYVCEYLLKRGNIVIGLDINENESFYGIENFIFIQENAIDTKAITVYKPNKVIHLASSKETNSNENIKGFINIMEECVKNNVEHVVYASSASSGCICASDFVYNHEACTNLITEIYAKLYYHLYKITNIGLRLFTVYGPKGGKDISPYVFIKAILNNAILKKNGNGISYCDYVYIDDVVNSIIAALDNRKKIQCEVYNVGSSIPISLNHLIYVCEKVTGKTAKYEQTEEIEQIQNTQNLIADISKTKNDLDFEPNISIEEGLTKLAFYIEYNDTE